MPSKTCNYCFERISLYRNKKLCKEKARMSQYQNVILCSSNECKLCCIDRETLMLPKIFYFFTM